MITIGQGIVLKELTKTDPDEIIDTELQIVLVHWAAKNVDLYTEARRFARTWVDDQGYEPPGMAIRNSDLQIVKSETGWLDAPSIEEMQMQRFLDVAENI